MEVHRRQLAEFRALLERDRPYAAVALASLEPEWLAFSRFYLDEARTSGLWVFAHPRIGSVVRTFGDSDGLEELLGSADLPARAYAPLRHEHADVVRRFFDVEEERTEWVMHVTTGSFRRPTVGATPRVLTQADGPAAAALYSLWDESFFQPSHLEEGWRYVGVFQAGQLVAIAGNQVRSSAAGVAKVTGVFAHPEWRGRGLGKAVVAGITEDLFDFGARDIVLNVREDNLTAIATYEQLGYSCYCLIVDSILRLRSRN